jgi:hypothetical protein
MESKTNRQHPTKPSIEYGLPPSFDWGFSYNPTSATALGSNSSRAISAYNTSNKDPKNEKIFHTIME